MNDIKEQIKEQIDGVESKVIDLYFELNTIAENILSKKGILEEIRVRDNYGCPSYVPYRDSRSGFIRIIGIYKNEEGIIIVNSVDDVYTDERYSLEFRTLQYGEQTLILKIISDNM